MYRYIYIYYIVYIYNIYIYMHIYIYNIYNFIYILYIHIYNIYIYIYIKKVSTNNGVNMKKSGMCLLFRIIIKTIDYLFRILLFL